MTPKLLLRIAAGCMLFFATGHTAGHLTRHNIEDEKAKAVLQQMMDTKFDQFGQQRSLDENYHGMSLNLIFTLLAVTVILWTLSFYTATAPELIKRLLLPIIFCIGTFAITSYLFFFPVPAVTCLIACIALMVGRSKLKA